MNEPQPPPGGCVLKHGMGRGNKISDCLCDPCNF